MKGKTFHTVQIVTMHFHLGAIHFSSALSPRKSLSHCWCVVSLRRKRSRPSLEKFTDARTTGSPFSHYTSSSIKLMKSHDRTSAGIASFVQIYARARAHWKTTINPSARIYEFASRSGSREWILILVRSMKPWVTVRVKSNRRLEIFWNISLGIF